MGTKVWGIVAEMSSDRNVRAQQFCPFRLEISHKKPWAHGSLQPRNKPWEGPTAKSLTSQVLVGRRVSVLTWYTQKPKN